MSVVFVHVGLPKTGTTYVQGRLWRNRDHAMARGVLYPGRMIDDHFHAAAHLQPERYLDWAAPEHADAWPAMVAQMRAWHGRSVVSHELFANAGPDHIRRLVDDLAFAEVHVILTVRDLGRQVRSVWQENVKNQRRATLEEFVATLDEPDGPEPFWEFQDAVRIAGDWAQIIGADRVHLVTVSAPGTSQPGDGVWERFVRVLGLDPADLPVDFAQNNQALSATQTEFLRRLNSRLQPDDVPWHRYEHLVKNVLIGEVMTDIDGGRPIALGAEQQKWAATRAEAMRTTLDDARYRVYGTLDDLRVDATSTVVSTPVTTDEAFDAALDTIAQWVKTTTVHQPPVRLKTRVGRVVRAVRRRALALRRTR